MLVSCITEEPLAGSTGAMLLYAARISKSNNNNPAALLVLLPLLLLLLYNPADDLPAVRLPHARHAAARQRVWPDDHAVPHHAGFLIPV